MNFVNFQARDSGFRIASAAAKRIDMSYASSLLQLLSERGYIHQATDASGLDAGGEEVGGHLLLIGRCRVG